MMVKAETTYGTKCVEFKSDGEKQADKISFAGSTMACAVILLGADTFSDNVQRVLFKLKVQKKSNLVR